MLSYKMDFSSCSIIVIVMILFGQCHYGYNYHAEVAIYSYVPIKNILYLCFDRHCGL